MVSKVLLEFTKFVIIKIHNIIWEFFRTFEKKIWVTNSVPVYCSFKIKTTLVGFTASSHFNNDCFYELLPYTNGALIHKKSNICSQ